MRIGHGYDVHCLVDGRKLILGGVCVPYSKGLLGHSDADVLTHAIIDSLLGAAALGDIGTLFPNSAPSYKGISSLELLKIVCEKIQNNNYSICNIDSIIIAQEPKLCKYIEDMKGNISKTCDISEDKVNIKATTEERLGFTGALQGISAHAVALLS